MVSAGRGCEAAATVRTGCRWAKFSPRGELLDGKRFLIQLKGVVYKSESQQFCMKLMHGD